MELAVLADEGTMIEKNVKLHLDSISIDAADEGGYIVRCQYEGKKKGEHRYDSKTKLFSSSSQLANALPSMLEEMGVDMDDED